MKRKIFSVFVVLVVLFMQGCSKLSPKYETPIPTKNEVNISIETMSEATNSIGSTTADTIKTPTDEPIAVVTETIAEIVHKNIPGIPNYSTNQRVNDCSTGERISLGATTLIGHACDNWKKDKLERPADAPNGTYYPAIDIVRAEMGTNQIWMFAKISLYNDAAGQLPPELNLGFEIDTDLDSRGDYLILAKGFTSTEWTTDGVQVWWDQTNDVGGNKPHVPDIKPGDGYETLLFDAGQGLDPDLAWVRINPEVGSSIEFAFNPSFLPENEVFAWWAWSTINTYLPIDMELIDSQQDNDSWKIDNTCSSIFNSKPSNIIANICEFVIPTVTPNPTSIPSNSSEPSNPSGPSNTSVPSTPSVCVPIDCQAAHPGDPPGSWEWDSASCSCHAIN